MSELAMEFTDDNFNSEVESSDVPVLVDFWAEWCGPCKMLSPTIDTVAEKYNGKVPKTFEQLEELTIRKR